MFLKFQEHGYKFFGKRYKNLKNLPESKGRTPQLFLWKQKKDYPVDIYVYISHLKCSFSNT